MCKQKGFLKEYKELCLKYGLEIRGFDEGAFLTELNEEQKKYNKLSWEGYYEDIQFVGKYKMPDEDTILDNF